MTASASGADSSALAGIAFRDEDEESGPVIELTSDLAVSASLEFPGDVVLLPPGPPDAPSLLRLSMMPADETRDLVDQLLRLGYQLRRGAPDPGHPLRMQQFFVRGGPGGPLRLRCTGEATVLRGAEGRFTLAPAGGVRIAREATWAGDIDAGDDVWLEAGSTVRGHVRTPGVLLLDVGSGVEGTLHVGRVRFRSEEALDPSAPAPALVRAARRGPTRAVQPVPAWPGAAADDGPDLRRSTTGPLLLDAVGSGQHFGAFEGLPPLPGRFHVVANVAPDPDGDELPRPLRTHSLPGRLLEVELLKATSRGLSLVLHPGTAAQRHLHCTLAQARRDPLMAQLIPVPSGVTTLRLVYGDGIRGVRASADSIRWLITLFGKILRLESRLDRLEEMRIWTGNDGAPPSPPTRAKIRRMDRSRRVPSRRRSGANGASRRKPTKANRTAKRGTSRRSPARVARTRSPSARIRRSARRPRARLGAP